MTAPIASTTAPPALRAGICCYFGTASALAQLTGELGRRTKYLDKQFSAAETLGALTPSFLEEVDAVSIVEDISVCSFLTLGGLKKTLLHFV